MLSKHARIVNPRKVTQVKEKMAAPWKTIASCKHLANSLFPTSYVSKMTESCTPGRIYFIDSVCVICFVISETDSSGNTVLRKFTNVKLRLMDERLTNIRQIITRMKLAATNQQPISP